MFKCLSVTAARTASALEGVTPLPPCGWLPDSANTHRPPALCWPGSRRSDTEGDKTRRPAPGASALGAVLALALSIIFYNLPSSGFSKIFVFFIMDNEHAKFFAFFVTNVTTWNFSFLL